MGLRNFNVETQHGTLGRQIIFLENFDDFREFFIAEFEECLLCLLTNFSASGFVLALLHFIGAVDSFRLENNSFIFSTNSIIT